MLVLAGSLGPLFGHRRCPAATIGLQSNCQSRRLPARVKLRISSPAWLGRSCPSICGATAIMYASPTAFRVRAQVARHVWLDIGIRARSSYPGLLSVIATANPPSAPPAKRGRKDGRNDIRGTHLRGSGPAGFCTWPQSHGHQPSGVCEPTR